MYECLLEKEDKILFNIYQILAVSKQCTLDELAAACERPVRYIRDTINEWGFEGYHLSLGIDFILRKNQVRLITTEHFDSRYLFAFLLERSSKMTMLSKLLENPSWGLKEIEKTIYSSPQTIRRKFRELSALLGSYELSGSFNKVPVICGKEAQQRFFRFHIRLLQEPPKSPVAPETYFQILEIVNCQRRSQGYFIDSDWFDRAFVERFNGLPEFRVDDRGFSFLWRQILGLEELWPVGISKALLVDQRIYPLDRRYTSRIVRQNIIHDINRLHLVCYLFQGPCADRVFADEELSGECRQLVAFFEKNLPQYQKILEKHPEIPSAYEKILRYRYGNQKNAAVAETANSYQ